MNRLTIKNRNDVGLMVQIDAPAQATGLAFVAHGQGGFIEQQHIQAFADAFLQNGFRVVRFDAANSIGESGGRMEDATITSYYQDLEDVVAWAKTQGWFQSPFALCGHSMGGMTTCLYAENHPEEVLCVAPISAVVSYDLFLQKSDPAELHEWQDKGYKEQVSVSKPGVVKRVNWSFAEDLKQYNVLTNANKLTMPVLCMAGANDTVTPLEFQKLLFEKVSNPRKKLVEIPNGDHNFRSPYDYAAQLLLVTTEISKWLGEVKQSIRERIV